MRRRDLILAGLGVGAFATAEALKPRRKLKLLQTGTIADALPARFGPWEAQPADLVNPAQAGRLARALYSETVSRTYFNLETGEFTMLLAAYGDTQSDLLQLHRPESCYPAVGFALQSTKSVDVPLRTGALLPARHVVATMEDRVENILYWTRMGEALPRTGAEQRSARLSNAMKGFVPDGILVRFSALGDSPKSFALLGSFVPALLVNVKPQFRPALIGSDLSRKLA